MAGWLAGWQGSEGCFGKAGSGAVAGCEVDGRILGVGLFYALICWLERRCVSQKSLRLGGNLYERFPACQIDQTDTKLISHKSCHHQKLPYASDLRLHI